MIAGYYTTGAHPFAGSVSDEHLKMWEVNMEVYREGLKLIRPGARCCDIAHV